MSVTALCKTFSDLTLVSPIKIAGVHRDVISSAAFKHAFLTSSLSLQLTSWPSNVVWRAEDIWWVFKMVIPCKQTLAT